MVTAMTTALMIKQVADASGFSAATLRYYEQIGLLPEASRTPAGYRTYNQHTLDRLAFIARSKQLGCSLEEIAGLTTAWEGGRCGPVQDRLRDLVAEKIASADRQVAELTTLASELRRAAISLEGHRPEGACDADCGCVGEPAGASAPATAQVISLLRKPDAEPTPAPAIACTLSSTQMDGRVAEWRALLAHVTRRLPMESGLRAEFAASVPTQQPIGLVAAEQDCCQFFDFAITIDGRGIALEVRAPADAQQIVVSLFGVPA